MHLLKTVFRSRTIYRRFLPVSILHYKSHRKICVGKEQLEELKNMKKVAEPIFTAEEKASKVNKAEIKGTGF